MTFCLIDVLSFKIPIGVAKRLESMMSNCMMSNFLWERKEEGNGEKGRSKDNVFYFLVKG